jgi:hypothetical protein
VTHQKTIEGGTGRKRRRRDRRRLSQMLRALLLAHPEPRMNVWQLRDALADRAYGVLLFIFAFPNIVPLPPGVSTVLSILIIIIAVQFVIGQPFPYFPSWLGKRSFSKRRSSASARACAGSSGCFSRGCSGSPRAAASG